MNHEALDLLIKDAIKREKLVILLERIVAIESLLLILLAMRKRE